MLKYYTDYCLGRVISNCKILGLAIRCVNEEIPVTGDLSSFVRVSFFTNLLNTEEVNQQALRTAATATCFSVANERDIERE
jgi:hypothetical protein